MILTDHFLSSAKYIVNLLLQLESLVLLCYIILAICYNIFNICARGSTDRASDSGSEGWGFESLRACHGKTLLPSGNRVLFFYTLINTYCSMGNLREEISLSHPLT